jgi:GT2 family glycosyltransferase
MVSCFLFLKQLHHKLLVARMLHKRVSLFGTRIQSIEGQKRTDFLFKAKKSKTPKIAVIVLNYNNQKIIGSCLDSLIKFNDYHYQIIVVDNKSNDESVKIIKEKFKNHVKLLFNSKNGAATGRNLGAAAAQDTDYLMFIDSDQGPTAHHWLDGYLAILEHQASIAMVGNGGGFLTETDLTGPTFDYYPQAALPADYLYRTNIDYLTAGGSLVRRQSFWAVGGFDETYDPHIFEDTDLSRKLVTNGQVIAYCKDLAIYHFAHSTTQANQNNQSYLLQYAKNAEYFRQKWL